MNKMLQKIVTKYPWKCVDVSVYHNKANANKMLHQILTKWTGSNKTNKIKKKGWLPSSSGVGYIHDENLQDWCCVADVWLCWGWG
jgi:Zn-finger protein